MSLLGRLRSWLDERFGWDALIAPLRKKTVPLHRFSYWYFLGGITLFLFMTRVQFGWLIRSIHSWSANLMIFTAFAHMFSVLFFKAYRKPRELTWVSGVILLFLVMGFGFSGYLLPWNTLAFFATKVGTEITGQVPIVGRPLMIFLRGGEEVTGATLTRFFGFHVAVLPGLATLLILVHLLLVQRHFNPSLRTDQLSQYRTSVHGKRLAAGDTKVAVCTDCHSVRDLRAPSDARSTVNPVNVANTCARCHADAGYLAEYKIPTSQFAEYGKSVHHDALVHGDLSAPTCTTCHGNHGATPPGFASVANVCSNCHVFQAQLFDSSPHSEAFKSAGLPGYVTCHSNHGIFHPTDELIGTDDKAVCTQCHTEGDAGFVAAGKMKQQLVQLGASIHKAEQILSRAEQSGMEVSQSSLDLVQAKDVLTKARVTVHSFNVARIESEVKPGMETAAKGYEAGKKAMAEREYRRVGLGISLVAIALVLVGLRLYLK